MTDTKPEASDTKPGAHAPEVEARRGATRAIRSLLPAPLPGRKPQRLTATQRRAGEAVLLTDAMIDALRASCEAKGYVTKGGILSPGAAQLARLIERRNDLILDLAGTPRAKR